MYIYIYIYGSGGSRSKVSHIYIIIKHCNARGAHAYILIFQSVAAQLRIAIQTFRGIFIPRHQQRQQQQQTHSLSLSFSPTFSLSLAAILFFIILCCCCCCCYSRGVREAPGPAYVQYLHSVYSEGYFAAYILACKSRARARASTILDFTRVNYKREREAEYRGPAALLLQPASISLGRENSSCSALKAERLENSGITFGGLYTFFFFFLFLCCKVYKTSRFRGRIN